MERPSPRPKAIPTLFNGVTYKSRMEARFAEWLHGTGVSFEYERTLPDSKQAYTPDFCIDGPLGAPLYIEIKPQPFMHELFLFLDDITYSEHNWICVDKADRERWRITCANASFHDGYRMSFPYSPCFDFVKLDDFSDAFLLRVYPEYVELNWY